MVSYLNKDDLFYTKEQVWVIVGLLYMINFQQLLSSVEIAMAGRAAEELIFGSAKVTQGLY